MSGESYHFETLQNGIDVCLVNVPHARSVRADICIRGAGTDSAPADKPEAAHLMEHLSTRECRGLPRGMGVRDVLALNGSDIEPATYDEVMQYSLTSPEFGYKTALNAFLRSIDSPKYIKRHVEAEREIVREELTGYLDEDEHLLWPYVRIGAGYPGVTLDRSLKTLDDITLSDLRDQHERTHVTSNMKVVVTANYSEVSDEVILRLLRSVELPHTSVQSNHEYPDMPHEGSVILDLPERNNIYYSLTKFNLPKIPIDQQAAFKVADSQLFYDQEMGIMTAWDTGLMYNLTGGRRSDVNQTDVFHVAGDVGQKNLVQLMRLFERKIGRVGDDASFTGFEALRARSIGNFLLGHESAANIHEWATESFYDYGTVRPIADITADMHALTPDMVHSARRSLVRGGVAVIGALGPNLGNNRSARKAINGLQELLEAC